jgi:hypothetical protein
MPTGQVSFAISRAKPMNLYRCYLYGAVGTKPVCMSIQGDSDSQARRTAMQVLHDRPDVERVVRPQIPLFFQTS